MTDPTAASDIEAMIRATAGVPVTLGGVDTWGAPDRVDPGTPGGYDIPPNIGPRGAVAVATGVLSGPPSVDDPITVDGEAAVVLDLRELEDGELIEVVYGDWTHTVDIYRYDVSGTASAGQQQKSWGNPIAEAVGCDLWARSGEVRSREYAREAVGNWAARLPPGTDVQADDGIRVTDGEGPGRYRVVFVGDEVPRRRIPIDLVESGEDFG